jgi:predicted aspartyl protease
VLTRPFSPNGPAGVAWKTGTSRGSHALGPPHGPPRRPAPPRSLLARCLLLATLALAGCAQSPQGACPLVWRATLPIDPRDNLIFLGAMFNDQPATMLMDTGAERTTLTEAAVTRLHLHRDLQHPTNTFGIGGPTASYEAIPDDFAIGVFRLPVDRVKVGTFALPEFGDVRPDGLLGADILLAFDLDIDLPAHRLTIYRARPCAGSKPPWTEPYSSVEGVGMWRDRLILPLSVNGADGRAVLDTGAQRSVLRPEFAARAGVTQAILNTDPSHLMRGASREEISFRLHRFDTVRIGTQIAHDVSLPVAPLPGGEEDALIGGDFLHGRRIWLSAASHQMFFTAPQP